MRRHPILTGLFILALLAGSVFFVYRAIQTISTPPSTGLLVPPSTTRAPRPTLAPEEERIIGALYAVHTTQTDFQSFFSLPEALRYAAAQPTAQVYDLRTQYMVWDNETELPESAYIEDVPLILQLPELPRGCEVTSLSMFLHTLGMPVDKMTLADRKSVV